ncbi:MAG: methionine adenosyltransferase domain-containing protein, partial [Planctomycetes bacterium]|nr:methionine adenosyltransferase domain-containing protein [Planctomycetota bacterium]
VAEPVSVMVDTEGTGVLGEEELAALVRRFFPLTPKKMIDYLNLRRPIYLTTARYGHFGRKGPTYTWEKTDLAPKLRKAAGLK